MPLWRLQSEAKTCSIPGRHEEGHFRVNVCGPEVSPSLELTAEAGDGEVPFPLAQVTLPAMSDYRRKSGDISCLFGFPWEVATTPEESFQTCYSPEPGGE